MEYLEQRVSMEASRALRGTKEVVVLRSQRQGGKRAQVWNENRGEGVLSLPLLRALVRRRRGDVRQCFPLLIPHLHLSLPQIIPRPNHTPAARAYHIPMVTAQLLPPAYPQPRLSSLPTSARTRPSMPNYFASQKPGEVSLLSTPHHHSYIRHRRPTMTEDTQGWTHKGE